MNAEIGHNGGPDIDGPRQSLRTQWAKALFADPNTPVYVMAMAWPIHWYSRSDGTGAALSNEQFMLICGISEDTATRGKKWLRDKGYVQIHVGNGKQKTQFRLSLPTADATEDIWVRTQRTQEGPHTAGPQGQGPHTAGEGPHTADPRVRTQRGYIQERDSGDIPDRPKDVSRPQQSAKTNYWQQQFNPTHSDYQFDGSTLTLVNGTRSRWLIEFGDDPKRLDFALKEVAARIQPNGSRPLDVQVEAALARMAAEKLDKDGRYASAVKANKSSAAKSVKPSRF